MVANYNDLLRKKISDCFKDKDEYSIIDFFYNLKEEEQEILMRLALCDLYKLDYYIDGTVSGLFDLPINQLINKCITDVGLALELLGASKVFNDMDYVSKTLLLETMQDNDQDRNIYPIYKFHVLDKFTYAIIDDIEDYKEYYKEYLEVNNDKIDRITSITKYICYRIIDLKQEDEIKYKKYILEFIRVYYKWKNFIKDHDGEYLLNNQDFIYLNIINKETLDEIFVEIEDDFDFLFTVVGEYLYYKTQKIEVKEEFVDEYLFFSSDEKLKEKLKIKEN